MFRNNMLAAFLIGMSLNVHALVVTCSGEESFETDKLVYSHEQKKLTAIGTGTDRQDDGLKVLTGACSVKIGDYDIAGSPRSPQDAIVRGRGPIQVICEGNSSSLVFNTNEVEFVDGIGLFMLGFGPDRQDDGYASATSLCQIGLAPGVRLLVSHCPRCL